MNLNLLQESRSAFCHPACSQNVGKWHLLGSTTGAALKETGRLGGGQVLPQKSIGFSTETEGEAGGGKVLPHASWLAHGGGGRPADRRGSALPGAGEDGMGGLGDPVPRRVPHNVGKNCNFQLNTAVRLHPTRSLQGRESPRIAPFNARRRDPIDSWVSRDRGWVPHHRSRQSRSTAARVTQRQGSHALFRLVQACCCRNVCFVNTITIAI